MQASRNADLGAAVARVVYALALALWMGGLIVLGAIVAPTVFRVVPAPTSADAMTVVFRRFDVIAITCAVLALLSEAALVKLGTRALASRWVIVRAAATTIASGLAITEGAWLSPAIAALHEAGAIRHMNAAGMELDRLHHIAESLAKAELVLLLVALVGLMTAPGLTTSREVKLRA